MYSLLLAIIYLAFIGLGLPDSLVGAGWPVMHQDLGVPTGYAGFITMIIAGGTIISSLMSDRLTRRFGTGMVTAVSVGMTAAALIGFSNSSEFWMLLVWAIPYGLGAGAVDAALNNYVALHYSSRVMSWLHGCWGIGASISPFIMGFVLSHNMGWSAGYLIVGSIQVVLTAILLFATPLWNKVNPPETENEDRNVPASSPLSLAGALRIPGVGLMLAAFFGYCAYESTAVLWGATFMVDQRGVTAAKAATFASLFLIGITVGRFLSGIVADRIGDRGLIRYGVMLMVFGAALVAIPVNGHIVSLAGLLIAGLGCAPVYPAIIHSTPSNFGRDKSQAIIGIQMAAAYTGTTLMPPLFGFIAQAVGFWLFPFYLAMLAALILVMSGLLNKKIDQLS